MNTSTVGCRSLNRESRGMSQSDANGWLVDTVSGRMRSSCVMRATVSAEEGGRGKPAPDVYLEAASLLGVEPAACGAVEDSSNGIRSAHAAGMFTVAIPNRHYPPSPDALALADVRLPAIAHLGPEIFGLGRL